MMLRNNKTAAYASGNRVHLANFNKLRSRLRTKASINKARRMCSKKPCQIKSRLLPQMREAPFAIAQASKKKREHCA